MTAFAGITGAQLWLGACMPCIAAGVALIALLTLAVAMAKHPDSRKHSKESKEQQDETE